MKNEQEIKNEIKRMNNLFGTDFEVGYVIAERYIHIHTKEIYRSMLEEIQKSLNCSLVSIRVINADTLNALFVINGKED